MWVENRDRHTGNLLRTKTGDYIPIDNEYALYSLVWVAAGFTCASKSLREQAQALLKPAGYTKFEVSMMLAAQKHKEAFIQCTPSLQKFIMALVANPVEATDATVAIVQFLGQRAHPDWLANELGLIS
jgi:hypothetical protein